MRSSWHQHWMEAAEHAAKMSTCASGRKVGAVFVRNNRLLVSGFNGVPAKYPHPLVCERKERGIPSGEGLEMCACAHAEANGIANAAREGVNLYGSQLFCTTEPCVMCMGALANVGVKEVIYKDAYHHPKSKDIANKAEIPVLQYADFNGVGILKLEDS